MKLTYGLERECAFFDPRGKQSAEDIADILAKRYKNTFAGFRLFVDCGHLEIASPPKPSLLGAVSAAREIDAIQKKICGQSGVAAWKGNVSYFDEETFATHDNYVFYGKKLQESVYAVTSKDAFAHAYATRFVICGEGGFCGGNFAISPRVIYRSNSCDWKGLRLHSHCSMDNCSPVSTAIRLGSVPIILGLGILGKLPKQPIAAYTGQVLSNIDGPLPRGIVAALEYQLMIATAAAENANEDIMITETAVVAKWWKWAAEEILAGRLPLWLDWPAKLAAYRIAKFKTASSGWEADTNWHRLDADEDKCTPYSVIEASLMPHAKELVVPYKRETSGLCGLLSMLRCTMTEQSRESLIFYTQNSTIEARGWQNDEISCKRHKNTCGFDNCFVIPSENGLPIMKCRLLLIDGDSAIIKTANGCKKKFPLERVAW